MSVPPGDFAIVYRLGGSLRFKALQKGKDGFLRGGIMTIHRITMNDLGWTTELLTDAFDGLPPATHMFRGAGARGKLFYFMRCGGRYALLYGECQPLLPRPALHGIDRLAAVRRDLRAMGLGGNGTYCARSGAGDPF